MVPLVYFNARSEMTTIIDRIISAGGLIMKRKEEIAPAFGYYRLFEDTDGNLLALQGDD